MKRQRREPKPAPAPAPAPPPNAETSRSVRIGRFAIAAVFTFQGALLALAAARNAQQLNTDAIAYLRIAGYWAGGQTDLMVSGYWGPLLSWLIAPLLKFGLEPLVAARAVMAASALVFSVGAFTLLRRLRFPACLQVTGTAVCALASIYWSVELIAPDLLLAGLFCLAVSELFTDQWLVNRASQARAGLWWALACFAKPVAFPLAFVVTAALAALHRLCRTAGSSRAGLRSASSDTPHPSFGHPLPSSDDGRRKEEECVGRSSRSPGDGGARLAGFSLAATLGVFSLIAGPWVAVLSVKYGGFTFSTSGRINHAIVGPGNADNIGRYHPFVRKFHTPDPGRVTMWEDPSRMHYPYWSPFQGLEQMRHQFGLIRRNAQTVAMILANVDWFALGLLSLLACGVAKPPWRETLARERWRWVLAPVVCLGGIYTPVYVQPVDERYFHAALPLLLASALGVAVWLTGKVNAKTPWPRRLAVSFVCVSFALYPLFRTLAATGGLRHEASRVAHVLAEKLRSADLSGPVAGSGLSPAVDFQRPGLYTAFLLGVPWHGDEVQPTPERFLQSGARLAIVPRGSPDKPQPLAKALAEHPGFRNLDSVLFATPREAADFPVQVFEIRR